MDDQLPTCEEQLASCQTRVVDGYNLARTCWEIDALDCELIDCRPNGLQLQDCVAQNCRPIEVPEPGVVLLLIMGAIALTIVGRIRR